MRDVFGHRPWQFLMTPRGQEPCLSHGGNIQHWLRVQRYTDEINIRPIRWNNSGAKVISTQVRTAWIRKAQWRSHGFSPLRSRGMWSQVSTTDQSSVPWPWRRRDTVSICPSGPNNFKGSHCHSKMRTILKDKKKERLFFLSIYASCGLFYFFSAFL